MNKYPTFTCHFCAARVGPGRDKSPFFILTNDEGVLGFCCGECAVEWSRRDA
ncbi:MAG TPA: hypothetical protein VM345_01850 [Acidimicrobiales bacterium]|nr:hypothetical protein [Acidimicrobiales bacterium]